MLVGFFKNHEESDCKCQVIKYIDRIWVDEKVTTSFFRSFIIRVLPDSPCPLSEVKLLLPVGFILDLTNKNDTCFKKGFYFNEPHIKTTNSYKVIKYSNSIETYDAFSLIENDGIENIKVFTGKDSIVPILFPLNRCKVIQLRFPVPISANNIVESRLSFTIPSLCTVINPGAIIDYNFTLDYLSKGSFDEEIKILGKSNEIEVIPTLGGEKHSGGFDIWVYLPPHFEKVSGFTDAMEKTDYHIIDGTENEPRIKLGWRLRHRLKKENLYENTPITSEKNLGLCINGIIRQRYDSKADLAKLCEQVGVIPLIDNKIQTIDKQVQIVDETVQILKEEVTTIDKTTRKAEKDGKKGIKLAIIGIILAVIIPIGIEIYKSYLEKKYQKETVSITQPQTPNLPNNK